MKRSLVPAVLFVTLAASSPLVACGGPDQPPAAPAPAATAPPPDLSARPPQSVQPLPVAPAPAPTTAPVAEVLPPPKPTIRIFWGVLFKSRAAITVLLYQNNSFSGS